MEDYESVLRVILGDSTDQWLGNPDITCYLSELSTYPIERFVKEPERLAEERTNILEQTQDLAFSNYKTFIQTAECSRGIYKDFRNVENQLDSLGQQLPAFREQCNKFNKAAQQLSSQRRLNSLTLSKHTHLLEVLELPQLMDTCVRRGYFQYALELAQHVRRMEKKHPHIPIVSSIVNEAQKSLQLMLSQLLSQLRSSVQLPLCLEVIGYIRQMGVFTEAELRVQFLQTRDAWFQGLLAAVPKDDAYQHITKIMELSRYHLFDIINQYRVIFKDEDPLLASNNLSIFTGWVLQKVEQFLSILEQDLSRGMGGRLDSVLGQCMYFGLSMSRVGADFRPLLQPIFFRVVQKNLKDGFEQAGLNFARNMQDYSLKNITSSQAVSSSILDDSLHPPMSLVEFPPVAEFCNELLTTLNDLRQFAPLGLAGFVTVELSNLLQDAAKEILSLEEREPDAEKDAQERLSSSFANDLVPYLDKVLQNLFPPQQIATLLGMPLSQVHQEKLGCLDVKEISNIVEHLLPKAQEIILPVTEKLLPESSQSKVEAEKGEDEEGTSTEREIQDAMGTEVIQSEDSEKTIEPPTTGEDVLVEEHKDMASDGSEGPQVPEIRVGATSSSSGVSSPREESLSKEGSAHSSATSSPREEDASKEGSAHSSETSSPREEDASKENSSPPSVSQSRRECDDESAASSKSTLSSTLSTPRDAES